MVTYMSLYLNCRSRGNLTQTPLRPGKSLSATRLAGGTPSLQFKDKGTLYGKNGNNGGGNDLGKWRVEDGKLCMSWQRWKYEGCGQLVRVGDKVQHLYSNASTVHLVFSSQN